jgi:hypothetical protein
VLGVTAGAVQFYSSDHSANADLPPATFEAEGGLDQSDHSWNAEVQSSNSILDLPLSYLNVHMTESKDSNSAWLELTGSHILVCGNADDIYVQFDSGPREAFTCTASSDSEEASAPGRAYLDDAEGFISKARRSRTMVIEPLEFGHGRRQFTFTASRPAEGQ